jgi:predicted ferric reductase
MKKIFLVIAIIVVIILAYKFDYSVWRLQHPTAPGWTYIFSHNR